MIVASQVLGGYVVDAGGGGPQTAIDLSSPYNSTVGIRFLTSGVVQIRKDVNGALSWVNHGRWLTGSASPGNFSARFTNQSAGDDFTVKAALVNVFIALSANRTWEMAKSLGGSFAFSCDFQVRDDVGDAPTATRGYSFSIENG